MERLQKILATAGIGSRRQCENIILQGRISVDNQIITQLGMRVDISQQKICFDGEPIRVEKKCYYLFYKPRGVLCTNSANEYPRVIDYFKGSSSRLFTIGRLDKDSEGLILVTNDGCLAQYISHPSHEIARIYHIKVDGYVTNDKIAEIRSGVWISEGKITPQKLQLVHVERNFSILEIILKEGKNREIRRIFEKVGHPVRRIIRIQFGSFKLEDLKPGCYRKLPNEIIQSILAGKK